MGVQVKAQEVGAAAVVLFPAADLVLRVLPTPPDFALFIKLPAMLLCLLALRLRPPRPRLAVVSIVAGIALVAGYVAACSMLLYANPSFHRDGDSSLAGLWPTDEARRLMNTHGWVRDALHEDTAPQEWPLIYSRPSQLAAAALLAGCYWAGLLGLTLGFRGLGRDVQSSTSK